MLVLFSIEVVDYTTSLFSDFQSTAHFEEFQPAWIVLMAVLWLSIRQTIQTFPVVSNPGRVIGIIHAVVTCLLGIPIILVLGSSSFHYADMYQSLLDHWVSIRITANIVTYTSVGYFVADSFFLQGTSYLKHHIGAIVVFVSASYHHYSSGIHQVCVVTLFESGAILVQLSKSFPNLTFRSIICVGYTATRVALAYYYGFIIYTNYMLLPTMNLTVKLVYIPIYSGLFFLLAMNAKWCYLQWKSLIKAYRTSSTSDFYSLHQKIIGAAN